MSARYIVGDVFDGLATLEPDSIDLVFSSPPFLALRSYLPSEHPDKGKEIGSEATPADFLDTLLDVVEACDRVLAPHGSLCFELGDTFAGGTGWSGIDPMYGERSIAEPIGAVLRGGKPASDKGRGDPAWPLSKSLCGIPTLFAWSLAYGRNLLRPERETPRWRIRNLVVWARPNPPVGALGDKFRPATSYVTVATKARDRYFDLDAVRTDHAAHTLRYPREQEHYSNEGYAPETRGDNGTRTAAPVNPAGAPPLDYWVIPTAPYKGSHYATFPPDLVVKPVKAMCPQRVCRTCGEPSRRITGDPEYQSTNVGRVVNHFQGTQRAEGAKAWDVDGGNPGHVVRTAETLGWSDCGHNDWRPGLVLDPFAGSGTTLAVASGHGRDAIGIDLDARNADLALERVGPLLMTVETLTSEPAA